MMAEPGNPGHLYPALMVVGVRLSVTDGSKRDIPYLSDTSRYLRYAPVTVRVPDNAVPQDRAPP